MKKMYKLIFTFVVFMIFKSDFKALTYGGCDYTTVANLKKLINNIDVSYTYSIINNEAVFDVTLANIPPNVSFRDSYNSKKYFYSDTSNGEIIIRGYKDVQDGNYTFSVKNGICDNVKLGTKYYKFPIYNHRMNSDSCKDIPKFSLCKKWLNKYYYDYEFEREVKKYKESLEQKETTQLDIKYEKDFFTKLIEFYVKYYYVLLPAIIVIFGTIIIVYNRKGRFKL